MVKNTAHSLVPETSDKYAVIPQNRVDLSHGKKENISQSNGQYSKLIICLDIYPQRLQRIWYLKVNFCSDCMY